MLSNFKKKLVRPCLTFGHRAPLPRPPPPLRAHPALPRVHKPVSTMFVCSPPAEHVWRQGRGRRCCGACSASCEARPPLLRPHMPPLGSTTLPCIPARLAAAITASWGFPPRPDLVLARPSASPAPHHACCMLIPTPSPPCLSTRLARAARRQGSGGHARSARQRRKAGRRRGQAESVAGQVFAHVGDGRGRREHDRILAALQRCGRAPGWHGRTHAGERRDWMSANRSARGM